MTIGITKEQQTRKHKEPEFNGKDYFRWIHSNNKCCVICGRSDIEIHHITSIKEIEGKRRDDKRVVCICVSHHRIGKQAIHTLSKEDFYRDVMSLEDLLKHSRELYIEYLEQ